MTGYMIFLVNTADKSTKPRGTPWCLKSSFMDPERKSSFSLAMGPPIKQTNLKLVFVEKNQIKTTVSFNLS